jgi:hypothetical protein
VSGLNAGKALPSEMDDRQWDRWNKQQTMTLALNSYTVTTLPDVALHRRELIFVSNETGGATVAFSDGTHWRRVQDRAVVS